MKKVFTIPLVNTLIQWINEKLQGKSDIDHTHSNASTTNDGLYPKEHFSKVHAIPASPKYTDTVTTINGKTGAIAKSDITALGIPAQDTNTITTINGKTGAITKTDITALGIPAQDTVYTHPESHPAEMIEQDSERRMVSDAQITVWDGKVDKVDGKGLSTNDYSNTDKAKVNAIPVSPKYTDTVYTHPTSHPASMITQDSTRRMVSDTQIASWNGKVDKVSGKGLSTYDYTSAAKNKVDAIPASPKYTDTITTINGKTGAITKADITALGIPAQDTVVDISGKADKTYVDNKVKTDVPVDAKFTDTIYTHPTTHPASMITGLPTSLPANGGNADTVGGFTVGVNVPANAKFTDTNTTYSEISTAEIDAGTASTGRTITGRRVKYILDKTSSMISAAIGALTKSSVGLGNVNNTSDANKPISTATQAALNGKVNNSQVLTNVPSGAKFTDTVTTINGKTGAITKADITALGIPAQDTVVDISGKADKTYVDDKVKTDVPLNAKFTDTVYSHPSTHPASMITGLPTSLPANGGDATTSKHLVGDDTRSTNSSPSVYMSGGSRYVSRAGWQTEFKYVSTIGLTGLLSGTYCYLQTHTPWSEPSGGYPIQVAYGNGTPCWRVGVSTSAWSAWQKMSDGGNANTVNGFTVGANVPANAKFTDTVYSHPTTAGNKHIPAGGASGQVLKYSANGTATWQTDKDTITTINGKTGTITKADITALGIPAQDTVYTHPSTHPASMITQDSARRMVSDAQIASWTNKVDRAGGEMTGALVAKPSGDTRQVRNITIGTTAPTSAAGYSEGDIFLVVP